MGKLFSIFGILLISILVFAQAGQIPDGDPLKALVDLITNWQTMSPIAIGLAVVVIGTQALKKFAPDWPYNRLTVSLLSVIYGVVTAVTGGASWTSAAVLVLITGGGAVAIYEALKGLGILGSAPAPVPVPPKPLSK